MEVTADIKLSPLYGPKESPYHLAARAVMQCVRKVAVHL
jgi:hypothetical protein